MLVDPNTGEPISITDPGGMASTATSQFLSHLPTATETSMWNMMRGSRTIRFGGFKTQTTFFDMLRQRVADSAGGSGVLAPRIGARGGGGRWANHNPFRPRTWTRMSDPSLLTSRGTGKNHYTPVGQLAEMGDWAANRVAAVGMRSMSNVLVGGKSNLAAKAFAKMHTLDLIPEGYNPAIEGRLGRAVNKGQFFTPGVMSRISAASKLTDYNGATGWKGLRGMRQRASSMDFIRRVDPQLYGQLPAIGEMSGTDISRAVLASSKGTFSQAIGGYVSGASGFGEGAGEFAGKAAFNRFEAMGARHIAAMGEYGTGSAFRGLFGGMKLAAEEGGAELAAKAGLAWGARAFGAASPFLGPIGWGMMTADLIRMGGAAMAGAVHLAKDAAVSLRGSINKPVMGMGYVDNEVAATSRARGVMAIQNSRLNARSVLGSEAGMVHAHFG